MVTSCSDFTRRPGGQARRCRRPWRHGRRRMGELGFQHVAGAFGRTAATGGVGLADGVTPCLTGTVLPHRSAGVAGLPPCDVDDHRAGFVGLTISSVTSTGRWRGPGSAPVEMMTMSAGHALGDLGLLAVQPAAASARIAAAPRRLPSPRRSKGTSMNLAPSDSTCSFTAAARR